MDRNPEAHNQYRFSARRQKIGAGTLAVLYMAIAGVGNSLDTTEKPAGPYPLSDAHVLTISGVDNSAYKDKKADALRLSDTFDGLIIDKGFSLAYDHDRLEKSLKSSEVAVIAQTGLYTHGRLFTTKKVVRSPKFEGVKQGYTEQAKILNAPDSMAAGLGRDTNKPQTEGKYTVFGFGFEKHIKETGVRRLGSRTLQLVPELMSPHVNSLVQLSVYHFEKDGQVVLRDYQESEVTLRDNIFCDEGTLEKITSEVVLTPEQTQVVCGMLENYGKFIPDSYRILLNAVSHEKLEENWSNDINQTLILTYPYLGKEQVAEINFGQVALHESFHAAYRSLDKNSDLFRSVQNAYDGIVSTMDYEMPSLETEANSNIRISDNEKVWRTITESTYLGKDSNMGHPWHNQTEMLSSIVTTLAYFPDEFIANYKSLAPKQQLAIGEAVNVVVRVIKHAGYQPTDIIPKYTELRKQLQTIK